MNALDKKPKSTWSQAWELFLNHWSEVITILFAIGGIVIQVVQNQVSGVNTILLSVLGLIAVSQLTSDQKLQRMLGNFESQNVSAEKFFVKSINPQDINTLFKQASTIDMMGVNLKYSIEQWHKTLEERVIAGARLRVLVMDPKGEGIKTAIARSNGEDAQMLEACYTFTLRKIGQLIDSSQSSGAVQIKSMEYPPSFGIFVIDDGKANARCIVKMYAHNGVLDGVYPTFEVRPWRDNWWYGYFVDQFLSQWRDGKANLAKLPLSSGASTEVP